MHIPPRTERPRHRAALVALLALSGGALLVYALRGPDDAALSGVLPQRGSAAPRADQELGREQERSTVVTRSQEAADTPVAAPVALNGALELRLENVNAEQRVVRSLLQRVGRRADGQPFAEPALDERTPDLWVADKLSPGAYDVYVWVSEAGETPRPFSRKRVKVTAGEVLQTSIDVSIPLREDEMEADS